MICPNTFSCCQRVINIFRKHILNSVWFFYRLHPFSMFGAGQMLLNAGLPFIGYIEISTANIAFHITFTSVPIFCDKWIFLCQIRVENTFSPDSTHFWHTNQRFSKKENQKHRIYLNWLTIRLVWKIDNEWTLHWLIVKAEFEMSCTLTVSVHAFSLH